MTKPRDNPNDWKFGISKDSVLNELDNFKVSFLLFLVRL